MAITRRLQDTINWARQHTELMPIVGVGGFENEPALTLCNQVLQKLLVSSYPWSFNRATAPTFDTVDRQQDYTVNVADVGWVERAYIIQTNSTQDPKPRYEIEVVQYLPKGFLVSTPVKLAKIEESDTTTTFRLLPIPGTQTWTVEVEYQKKPPLKRSLADTWSPFPDEFAFVYEQAFLALALRQKNDPRANIEEAILLSRIASALGYDDRAQSHEGFYPEKPILIG